MRTRRLLTRRCFFLVPRVAALIVVCILSCSGDKPELSRTFVERSRPVFSAPFVRPILFQSDRDGDFEIFSMHPDGSELRQLTFNDYDDEYPSWSPDSKKILFESRLAGVRQVCTMNADGTAQRQLTCELEDSCSASWSPDGHMIYFDRYLRGHWVIFRMNADGSSPEHYLRLDEGCDTILSSWAADGSAMTFSSNKQGTWHIYLRDTKTGAIIQLTDGTSDCRGQWSPNSQFIAYVSAHRDGRGDIWIMDRTGKKARCLTRSDDYDYYPTWSADSMKIVYATAPDKNRGPWNIMLVSIAGDQPLHLTTDECRNKYPRWY